jgi:hypothetical protein
MVALNNGFDLARPAPAPWRSFASTQAPLRLWFAAEAPEILLLAISQHNVAQEMGGFEVRPMMPEGARGVRTFQSLAAMGEAVRRAFRLSKTLPDELLHGFSQRTAGLPKTTEAERWVVQRIGQTLFRDGLLEYWQGRCALTGLAVPELLRASHIKPWAACETDAERLDVFNGFLLAPHLDAAFDRGFFTLDDDGVMRVSTALPSEARSLLGLVEPLQATLKDGHRRYLPWHRGHIFRE